MKICDFTVMLRNLVSSKRLDTGSPSKAYGNSFNTALLQQGTDKGRRYKYIYTIHIYTYQKKTFLREKSVIHFIIVSMIQSVLTSRFGFCSWLLPPDSGLSGARSFLSRREC